MSGGLIKLVATGIEDLYLIGSPQITFFKIIYRRHTNFSIESIRQFFSSSGDFGETVSCTLSRSGDLVGKIYLYIEIPSIPIFINKENGDIDNIKKFAWVRNLGFALIDEMFIEIGGKIIDKQYGEWLYLWSQVSGKQDESLNKMIGNIPSVYEFSNGKKSMMLYIPLQFWFCKSNGLALPIISLSSSNVSISFKFKKLEECCRIGPTHSIVILDNISPVKYGDYIKQKINGEYIYGFVIDYDFMEKKIYYIKIDCSKQKKFGKMKNDNIFFDDSDEDDKIYNVQTGLFCSIDPQYNENIENSDTPKNIHFSNIYMYVDYIYLDTEERIKFLKTNHEYLIEQIQFSQEIGIKNTNNKKNILFNHPCKSFYWIFQLDCLIGKGTINDVFNYTSNFIPKIKNGTLMDSAKIVLNGQERISSRDHEYFNFVEPYQHHWRGPENGIYMFSPSINPEDHQPSSTINMSMIDNSYISYKLNNIVTNCNTVKMRIYAINYNILRICFNMGGLAFS